MDKSLVLGQKIPGCSKEVGASQRMWAGGHTPSSWWQQCRQMGYNVALSQAPLPLPETRKMRKYMVLRTH